MMQFGRSQRPRRWKIKTTFQAVLLLGVCIWLLYQIKNQHDKSKSSSIVVPKVSKKYGSIDLGRKGNGGLNLGDSKGEGDSKEDGGDGDDELDRHSEGGKESAVKRREGLDDNVTDDQVKESEDGETEQEESQKNDEDKDEAQGKDEGEVVDPEDSEKDMEEKVGDEEEKEEKDSVEDHNEETIEGKVRDEEEKIEKDSVEDHDEGDKDGNEVLGPNKDENPIVNAERTKVPPAEIESSSKRESGTGLDNFPDENGIPPDAFQSVNVASNESMGTNIDEEPVSRLHNQTLLNTETLPESKADDGNKIEIPTDNALVGKEEVKSNENGDETDMESADNSLEVDTNISSAMDKETDSGTGNEQDKSSAD